MKKGVVLALGMFLMALMIGGASVVSAASDAFLYADNFEDGIINSSLWIYGGEKRGNLGVGGDWQWSNEEIAASDGYFKARVWGPYTTETYTGTAWIRSTRNFNDGKIHLINFVWEPDFSEPHFNEYFLQITDGALGDKVWWQEYGMDGTSDLLWREYEPGNWTRGLLFNNEESPGKLNWSLEIRPSGVARLYDAPDGDGLVISQEFLDPDREWYFKLMVLDGTSAGFGAGDSWFNLYDFSASVDESEQRLSTLESNMSSMFSWKNTIEGWKITMDNWKTTITDILANMTAKINGLVTKTDNQETRIKALENKTCNCQANQTTTLPNYFKYLSSSDRKKMVCGLAEEKHWSNITDLGWNCTVTYRTYRNVERATCRCEEIN